MKTLLLGFLVFIATHSSAYGSGCDYSCWTADVTVISSRRWNYSDYFTLTGLQNGSSVTMSAKKGGLAETDFPTPVIFSGYEWQTPLHPRLVNRLLDPKESSSGIVTKADIEIKVTDYNGEVTLVKTGQYKLEVFFVTGESVILYHPSLSDIVADEDGSILYENVLPLFFSKQ